MAKIGLLYRTWTYEIRPVPLLSAPFVKPESRIHRDPERAETRLPDGFSEF